MFEPQFGDKSIIDNTFQDIDHVIKDVERKWRGDILQLQAQIASWCPAWEPKAEELLTDVGAQTALMGMPTTRSWVLLLRGCPLCMSNWLRPQPADSKSVAATANLAIKTVVATYTLSKLRLALPKLAVKHGQVNGAKAF